MACDRADQVISQIAVSGTGPLSVSGDAGSVTQRPARDLIDAANYLAGICAAKTQRLGVRYTHLRPGATVSGLRRRLPRWDKGYEW